MIIADTGFWLALADEKDAYHQTANQAFQTYDEPLITTWPVMTETCYLLLDRKGVPAQVQFIHNYSQSLFTVFDLTGDHGVTIAQLMAKYADFTHGFSGCVLSHPGRALGTRTYFFSRPARLQRLSMEKH